MLAALKAQRDKFEEAMDDDINTPQALAELFKFRDALYPLMNDGGMGKNSLRNALEMYKKLLGSLGLVEKANERLKARGVTAGAIQDLIRQREELRKAKNYAESDKIRDALVAHGVAIEDTDRGVRWKIRI
jgi:cysteinyl-tRNA synthetase